jgi:signal transduction histidine kinase
MKYVDSLLSELVRAEDRLFVVENDLTASSTQVAEALRERDRIARELRESREREGTSS